MIVKVKESHQNQFIIAGISARTTNQNGQSAQDIGGLWTRFTTENLGQQISGKLSDDMYCAYTDYESDHNCPYTAVLGCKADSSTNIPDGFTGITVPGGDYQVYYLQGLFPANIGAAWRQIWASDIDRKYASDYDWYKAGADSFEKTEATIYLGVR
ncbi:GyrI-like domain-containing protein [Mucilaginibacter sp. L3T2-6]|uniref:GyrI-like domain-containing protein n=1 Tax=Mucilaginibacter sp. L3T2-6 TaxID=3062491 RepID=UPI002676015D|nr:effector binding domain-containing protein [Mucilaginibacter sp. L3T2-6]MDO3645171.1 effector binding domain-containing protein [Mucilaginibacter sp. L3T2-6]MDV6217629.1 effector binding domain-containing protein [Mucilaginibacter sp. L3T2-6]